MRQTKTLREVYILTHLFVVVTLAQPAPLAEKETKEIAMTKLRFLCAAIAAGAACASNAQADVLNHVYAGVGVSYSAISDRLNNAAKKEASLGAFDVSTSQGKNVASGRLFVGYDLNDNIAFEVGYLRWQDISANLDISANGTQIAQGKLTAKYSGFDYSVLLRPSKNNAMHNFFGRLGGTYMNTAISGTITGARGTIPIVGKESGSGWLVGAGYDYQMNKTWLVRPEFSYYGNISGASDSSARNFGINLIGRF